MGIGAITACLTSSLLDRAGALGLGSLLLVVITFIHVSGLDIIVNWYRRKTQNLQSKMAHPYLASWCFSGTILLMLMLHIGDICIWSVFLSGMNLIAHLRDALYFTANTYTCLGYGDSPLGYDWRELSPLIAISGLFTFACTTSQLFSVMGYHRDLFLELASKHRTRRAESR